MAGNHRADGDESRRIPDGILFDAYGTLFDLSSLNSIAEELFPGYGTALAASWREKQLDYSKLRTLCDLADQHGVELQLKALPIGRKPHPMTREQLKTWYERHGFQGPGWKLMRKPTVGQNVWRN